MSATAKPRLLVLASTYPRWVGDPEPAFVHLLASRLATEFDVVVLCPHARGAAKRELMDGVSVARYRYAPTSMEVLVNDGGIITNLRRRPWTMLLVPTFILAQMWAAWRLLRSFRPDVVHAHWIIPQGLIVALLGVFRRSAPPLLVTSHGADLFALRGRWLTAIKRFVLRRAALTTVVSQAMRTEVLRLGIDAHRVRVEPMGVDLQGRFTVDEATQRSHGELLFVGRLVEKKGLRVLLDALPRIIEQRPEVTLTVDGFGPEAEALRLQAQRLGIADRVTFLGAVSQAELPALYRRAAVFVAPFVQASSGDQEGLGLVLVEALACGCTVVASDLPAVRDVSSLPDVPLRLVVPDDPDALAACVLQTLQGSDRLGRPESVAQFDWSRRASAYAGLLRRMAEART